MPNSQIDMVVRRGGRWDVCGDFDVTTDRLDPKVDVYVVVRQGDVIARGHAEVGDKSWKFEVKPEGGELQTGQTAIVSAVAIAQEDPSGLEAFTWAQRVKVLGGRQDSNPPPVFAQPETVAGPGPDVLAADHAISSSLTVTDAGAEAAAGSLSWTHTLQTSEVPASS
jgi:hypothetical protein